MGKAFRLTLGLLVFLALVIPANASITYTGSLSDVSGLTTTGDNWGDSPNVNVVSIDWTVSDQGIPGYQWMYNYIFQKTGNKAGLSHFIIEVSDNAKSSDFTSPTAIDSNSQPVVITTVGPQTLAITSGNPNMPSDVFGLKFSPPENSGLTYLNLTFYSTRAPVWGDFYAKDGGNNPVNSAWNTSFLVADPTDGPGNGTIDNKILRPDGIGTIPEPTTIIIWSLVVGLAITIGWSRRRNSA
jgi:hypothetical protein